MPTVTIKLPAMGEGITDATIIRWMVKEGDEVKANQPLVEIATDKVDSEVSSPSDGVVSKILAPEGSLPRVGEIICIIVSGNDIDEDLLNLNVEFANANLQNFGQKKTDDVSEIQPVEQIFIPPFISLAASQLGITQEEIRSIQKELLPNPISRDDLLRYARTHQPKQVRVTPPAFAPGAFENQQQPVDSHEYTIKKMSRMRQLISSRMSDSVRTAPHVTSYVECDMTELVIWYNQNKKTFEQKTGFKLTYTMFFIEAVAQTLKKFPEVNVSIEGDYILFKKNINIGFAVILDNNDLIVPVVKQADKLSPTGIAMELAELTQRARSSTLRPTDVQGGTFTITNLGQFGTLTGTPIINQPESGIISIGAIIKKAAVVEIQGQHTIGIRDIVMLSHTYDHRIIDGGLGGRFLKSVSDYLSNFQANKYLF